MDPKIAADHSKALIQFPKCELSNCDFRFKRYGVRIPHRSSTRCFRPLLPPEVSWAPLTCVRHANMPPLSRFVRHGAHGCLRQLGAVRAHVRHLLRCRVGTAHSRNCGEGAVPVCAQRHAECAHRLVRSALAPIHSALAPIETYSIPMPSSLSRVKHI